MMFDYWIVREKDSDGGGDGSRRSLRRFFSHYRREGLEVLKASNC